MADAHTSINTVARCVLGGLELLSEQADKEGTDKAISTLTGAYPGWKGSVPFRAEELSGAIAHTSQATAHLLIIKAIAALEAYGEELVSFLALDVKAVSEEGLQVVERLLYCLAEEQLLEYKKLLTPELSLLRFFVLTRNRIAHTFGTTAGEAIPKHCESTDFVDAWESLRLESGEAYPACPQVIDEQLPTLALSHAVLCSLICFRAAVTIDRFTTARIGMDGVIKLAARDIFQSELATRDERIRALCIRCNELGVKRLSFLTAPTILKRLGLWDRITRNP